MHEVLNIFQQIITLIQETLTANIPVKNSVLSCPAHTHIYHKGLKSLLRLHQPKIVFRTQESGQDPMSPVSQVRKNTEQVQQRQIHSPKHKSLILPPPIYLLHISPHWIPVGLGPASPLGFHRPWACFCMGATSYSPSLLAHLPSGDLWNSRACAGEGE